MKTTFSQGLMMAALVFAVGCGGGAATITGEEMVGADDGVASLEDALSGTVAIGSTLKTTANLNLRSGPSTGYSVLRVIPSGGQVVTVERTSPSNSFYKVKYSGTVGWAHGGYLTFVKGPATTAPTTSARDAAIARAKSGVGFSYWWGHGRWTSGGPTSSTKGYCSGSCPNCSHSGSYGADCSGYVAKIWQVPSTNTNIATDSHPYSTYNFDNDTTREWVRISRGATRRGDALVYNANGAGHIVLFESGDAWGSMWMYEARGCAYGIQRNLRSLSSSYRAIARKGY